MLVVPDAAGNVCSYSTPDRHFLRAGLRRPDARLLSPEQIRGATPTPRSDVYAFGALLYEVLGGRPVFPHGGRPGRLAGAAAARA